MAKPTSKPQLSLDTAHVSDMAAGIPDDHWSRYFFQHIYGSFDDAQFADMYEEGGRYPIPPSLLASMTILQYVFKASDRVAVDNTVMRRDWRIALGRKDDWDGFDASVLCNFRRRLIENDMQRTIFDKVLEQLAELGLLSGRRRLRVDATHLLADVATLSRADMIQEAIRVVVCDLYKNYPELHERPDFVRLHDQYGEEVWLGRDRGDDQRLADLGRDGYQLLDLCACVRNPLAKTVERKDVLAQILQENFVLDQDDKPQPVPADERPPDRIVTPHEPDVRVGKKRDELWTGDKVHIVETADKGQENFIVDVVTTDPRVEDSRVTEAVAQRAAFRLPAALILLADGGYASAENTKLARAAGLDLVSPPRPNNRRGQIPASEFEFDFHRKVVRCPAGRDSSYWHVRGRELSIQFSKQDCAACGLRPQCTTNKRGRGLGVSKDYEQLLLDRRRAQQPEFARLYRLRAPVEATISELVHRCGLRRSRYRTAPRRALHAVMAATALNVRRLLRCLGDSDVPRQAPTACLLLL